MKKICMSLFLMMVPMATFPYKITNSPASTVPLRIELLSGLNFFYPFNVRASHNLKPGESGAWNQDAIRKKLKRTKNFEMLITRITREKGDPSQYPPFFKTKNIPINANLEILAVVDGKDVIGGAIDYSTGQVYRPTELNRAVEHIKRNRPDKLSSIEGLMRKANIK